MTNKWLVAVSRSLETRCSEVAAFNVIVAMELILVGRRDKLPVHRESRNEDSAVDLVHENPNNCNEVVKESDTR